MGSGKGQTYYHSKSTIKSTIKKQHLGILLLCKINRYLQNQPNFKVKFTDMILTIMENNR